jgi:hypothetical protein
VAAVPIASQTRIKKKEKNLRVFGNRALRYSIWIKGEEAIEQGAS